MSLKVEEGIKRWTAKRKSALVLEIIQGEMTVAKASRAYDLSPPEIEKSALPAAERSHRARDQNT